MDSEDGMGKTMVVLPPEAHELLQTALQAMEHFDAPGVPIAERRSTEQRRADALIDLIEQSLRSGRLPSNRGVKPHITVQVTVDTLTGDSDAPGQTRGGHWLSAEAARRLSCDSSLTRAVLNAQSHVLDMGRETSKWNVAQYKAAELTFKGCGFPVADGENCGRPVEWTELHHIHWWRRGGPTDQANGVALCNVHHRSVHHEGWKLRWDAVTGTLTASRTRDGRTLTRSVGFRPGLPPGSPAADGGSGAAAAPPADSSGWSGAGSDVAANRPAMGGTGSAPPAADRLPI